LFEDAEQLFLIIKSTALQTMSQGILILSKAVILDGKKWIENLL
jgi:hypothetical protein